MNKLTKYQKIKFVKISNRCFYYLELSTKSFFHTSHRISTVDLYKQKKCTTLIKLHIILAPRARLERATYRLTAECSTIELPRNIWCVFSQKQIYITIYAKHCQAKNKNFLNILSWLYLAQSTPLKSRLLDLWK